MIRYGVFVAALLLTTCSFAEDRDQPENRAAHAGPRPEHVHQFIEQTRDKIHHLRESGQEEAARELEEQLERKLHYLREQPHRGQPGQPGREDRIHHLFAAAENLEKAGFPEEAEKLRHNAERMRQQFHGGRGDELHELRQGLHHLAEHVERLTEHVERLTRTVHELESRQRAAEADDDEDYAEEGDEDEADGVEEEDDDR